MIFIFWSKSTQLKRHEHKCIDEILLKYIEIANTPRNYMYVLPIWKSARYVLSDRHASVSFKQGHVIRMDRLANATLANDSITFIWKMQSHWLQDSRDPYITINQDMGLILDRQWADIRPGQR